ncbi:hypothetical protein [Brevibacterium litoralis]|uniref:hypothetical protein n=1 Tax=Brevibacterium litoralis TaxID=3138935 RepID=UPI0032EB562C
MRTRTFVLAPAATLVALGLGAAPVLATTTGPTIEPEPTQSTPVTGPELTDGPTAAPTAPTEDPTGTPTGPATETPGTEEPTTAPTEAPTPSPTESGTPTSPTDGPTGTPTTEPATPGPTDTGTPAPNPTGSPDVSDGPTEADPVPSRPSTPADAEPVDEDPAPVPAEQATDAEITVTPGTRSAEEFVRGGVVLIRATGLEPGAEYTLTVSPGDGVTEGLGGFEYTYTADADGVFSSRVFPEQRENSDHFIGTWDVVVTDATGAQVLTADFRVTGDQPETGNAGAAEVDPAEVDLAAESGDLPSTGGDLLSLGAGAALLAVGATIVVLTRRPQN